MSEFRLSAGDILVNVNNRKDPISTIKRWLIGPYEHIFLYMGKVRIIVSGQEKLIRFPMLFESNGRGVVIQALSNRYDQEVVVLHLNSEFDRRRIPHVLKEAVKLASEPNSFYDYFCIPLHIIPRILNEKLGIPIPLKYHRNAEMICSEAVNEVFIRGGLPELLYLEDIPLPGDFVTERVMLEQLWAGKLSEELVQTSESWPVAQS